MATYTLTVRYNANGGTITTNCGTTGVYKYTSGSTNYWYKLTSNLYYRSTTSATSGFSVLQSTQTATNGSSGTSKTRTINLINVATANVTKTGYHIVSTQAYGTTASGGVLINQDTTASTDTNAATVYRMLGNAYISANKTVTLYVHWIPNTYTIHYNANGGSGTMADGNSTATTWNYGTSYALRSNAFTKTGYTFAGWATSVGGSTLVFRVRDKGPCIATAIGTDGNYLYLRQSSTYYRITVDGSNSYTSLGTTAPSGVTWVTGTGSSNTVTLSGNQYYYFLGTSSEHDWTDVSRIEESSGVVYTNGQSVSNLTTTDGGEVTLYAVWQGNTYTIHYNANGGSGTMASSSHIYGATKSLTLNGFIREGYKFIGWRDTTTNTWSQIFHERDSDIWGTPFVYDNNKIGIRKGTGSTATWYGWNGDTWNVITQPSSLTFFTSGSYAECDPTPTTTPSYNGSLSSIWYTSIDGTTYAWIQSYTDNYNHSYLKQWHSDEEEIDFIDGQSITTITTATGAPPANNTTITLYAVWTPVVYIKQNGTWKEAVPQIKVSGTWKIPNAAYVKVDGVWKQIY